MILELTSMSPTGEAIARHEGKVVFVPFGIPGEVVQAQINHSRRSYARAQLLQIIQPAPDRVTPPCAYFGACGGCEWQHIQYDAQLKFKTQAVIEQLVRIGKFHEPPVRACISSAYSYQYRNHTQFVISANGKPGYYIAASNQIIEVTDCPILQPGLNELLSALIERTQHGADSHGHELHLRTGVNTGESIAFIQATDGSIDMLAGNPPLHEQIDTCGYSISPESFFQVNTHIAQLLVNEIINDLELTGNEHVLDLYSGVGLFTVPICQKAQSVIAVEISSSATRDARLNLKEHSNCTLINDDVALALSRREVTGETWSSIVIDPPRAGVQFEALRKIILLRAPRIIYVACDTATLARDAHILSNAGYAIHKVQPFDMFPQTHHVETVTVFKLPVIGDIH
jgi:23S rRNA (uracil1939-C5)-methyltransferase